jgi:hypothetical protein
MAYMRVCVCKCVKLVRLKSYADSWVSSESWIIYFQKLPVAEVTNFKHQYTTFLPVFFMLKIMLQ